LRSVASALDRPTTITVSERTRRLLEAVKGEGQNYDELIQDLLEETYFDDAFYQEIERRWNSERRVSGRSALKRAGLE
jgi:hypothetical protein